MLTCQALCRAVVLRGTQALPYSIPTPYSTPNPNPPNTHPHPHPHSSQVRWEGATAGPAAKPFSVRCRPDEDAGKLLRRALRKSALVHMHAHVHVQMHVQVQAQVQVQVQVCSCVVCIGPNIIGGKLLRRSLRESVLAPRPRPQLRPRPTPPPPSPSSGECDAARAGGS